VFKECARFAVIVMFKLPMLNNALSCTLVAVANNKQHLLVFTWLSFGRYRQ